MELLSKLKLHGIGKNDDSYSVPSIVTEPQLITLAPES